MPRKGAKSNQVTIYSVAEHAGVSVATVSRVLQGSTSTSTDAQDRVRDAVRTLGYVPLRSGRSSSLRMERHGVVLASLGGPYYSELLMGYGMAASSLGLSVAVVQGEGEDYAAAALDLSQKVDGIVLGFGTVSDTVASQIAQKTPTLLLSRRPLPGCGWAAVENVESMHDLTQHVVEVHGRRRFAFVGDTSTSRDVEERHSGFTRALLDAGLVPVSKPLGVGLGDEELQPCAAQVMHLREDGLDALICANDQLALGLWRELRRCGVRVPDDLVITGFDDIMAAHYMYPGLTTVHQPARDIGAELARLLHGMTSGTGSRPAWTIPTASVLRGSCGCPED